MINYTPTKGTGAPSQCKGKGTPRKTKNNKAKGTPSPGKSNGKDKQDTTPINPIALGFTPVADDTGTQATTTKQLQPDPNEKQTEISKIVPKFTEADVM